MGEKHSPEQQDWSKAWQTDFHMWNIDDNLAQDREQKENN